MRKKLDDSRSLERGQLYPLRYTASCREARILAQDAVLGMQEKEIPSPVGAARTGGSRGLQASESSDRNLGL
jgi:hypothetical protein